MKPYRYVAIIEFECGWYKVMILMSGHKKPIHVSEKLSRTQAVQRVCILQDTEDFTDIIDLGEVG